MFKVEDETDELCHSLKILHVEDDVLTINIIESQLANLRPYILCCIIKDLNFTEALFKKFIQLQTKLHDTVCDKRNVATIATHDLKKIPPGDFTKLKYIHLYTIHFSQKRIKIYFS